MKIPQERYSERGKRMTQADLIPRRVLFGDPERTQVRLSPDGRWLAWIAPWEGVRNVWLAPADAPHEARVVTRERERGIFSYHWSYTSRQVLYLKDRGGDENWCLHATEVETGETKALTPREGVEARLIHLTPRRPNQALVALNERDPRFHDLFLLDLETGDRELLLRNEEGFFQFLADDGIRVRVAMKFRPDGGYALFSPGEGGWRPLARIGPEDSIATQPLRLDAGGKVLYLVDSRGRDTAALVALDLESGEAVELAQDPRCDAQEVLFHPTARKPQAVAFDYARRRWEAVDEEVAEDLAYLGKVMDGELEVLSRTLDDEKWLVAYVRDDGPTAYYLYHRAEKRAEFLFSDRPELEKFTLARMYPREIRARDGLTLVSYLSLPPWWDEGGRPKRPLPMVLFVHGGPWARDRWGFHPWHQWLANRGYAVLSVNFRGSTGFGKSFVNAGDREWAGKMHQDLIDAVEWAIREGIAERGKVAIMGGSYGGYATLVGLTFTPEAFCCGVDIVGPSNLITLLENIPPYWVPMRPLLATRIGDPGDPEDREVLWDRSPLKYADRIVRPLLIGQGANDPRVKKQESDQIVEALVGKGIPVTYVLYPDEGHGFLRQENRLSFMAIAEAFLGRFLGGRAEPIGGDFRGSSLTIPVGAEELPEVATALRTR
jgi:dipeptidyl aminopeptidase/acylaminoacyl peptidase